MFEFLGLAVLAGLFNAIDKADERNRSAREMREREERIKMENMKRRTTPLTYDNGLLSEDFKSIVRKSIKSSALKKRINEFTTSDSSVVLLVDSLTGLTEWRCELDFNDYGIITGNYWITQENDDSDLPDKLARIIRNNIIAWINMYSHKDINSQNDNVRSTSFSDNSTIDNTDNIKIYNQSKADVKKKKSYVWIIFVVLLLAAIVTIAYFMLHDLTIKPIYFFLNSTPDDTYLVDADTDYSSVPDTQYSKNSRLNGKGDRLVKNFYDRIKNDQLSISDIKEMVDANNMYIYETQEDSDGTIINYSISSVEGEPFITWAYFGENSYIQIQHNNNTSTTYAELYSREHKMIDRVEYDN